ncbi:hypothetical protein H0H92_011909 [Tricholoma furcatifolium]|nr:hypothetical protein H0H92_011909 [Tricholoma furcatifolium]
MLRRCGTQSSRIIASSSQSSSLHTSAVLHGKSRLQVARAIKKENILRQETLEETAQQSRPHVVLGTRPGDEAKWEQSLLAQTLVNVKELGRKVDVEGRKVADPSLMKPTEHPIGTVDIPKYTSFGIGKADERLLFSILPPLSSTRGHNLEQAELKVEDKSSSETAAAQLAGHVDPKNLQKRVNLWAENAPAEFEKASGLAKLIDLRNANAGGIAYENRRRIIEAFSTPENPYDTGRTEVQVALLTYRIRNLWNHLRTFKRDLGNRRGLRMLVHQRAKLLKYLKKKDETRYQLILSQLGLEPGSVEGELVV